MRRSGRFATLVAALSVAVALAALAGWTFRIAVLRSVLPGQTSATASVAVCCLLMGVALWARKNGYRPWLASFAAGIVALVGTVALLENLFDWRLGINESDLIPPIPALNFILLGSALLALDWRSKRGIWPAQWLALAALVAGTHTHMAPPGTILFLLIPLGVFCARAEWAFGGLLVSTSAKARLFRIALPVALIALTLFGWSLSNANSTEAQLSRFEGASLAVLATGLVLSFVFWTARLLDNADRERQRAEQSIQLPPEQINLLQGRHDDLPDERYLQRLLSFGLALAVCLIGSLGYLSWRNAQTAAKTTDWVIHTHLVSTTLELTLKDMLDVETGSRGFALTGQERFLEPNRSGKEAVIRDLAALRSLTADNSAQQPRLDLLEKQVKARIEAANVVVSERRQSARIPSDSHFERGKLLMDAVRITINEMEKDESHLLEQRVERAREARRFANSAIALASLIGVVFLLIAGVTLKRQIAIGGRARAEAHALNGVLEQRVEQRTAAMRAEVLVRLEAEKKLHASQEMFRLLLDGITDYAVYMLDTEGRVVSWNTGAAHIMRYTAEEILGQDSACFYTLSDRERGHPQEALRLAAEQGRFEEQGWRVRKNGSVFWANALTAPLFEANGSLRGYSKVVRDITERKQAEDELTESQERLAGIIESAMDAIISVDSSQQIVLFNGAAERMFLCPAAEALGLPLAHFIPQRFHAAHKEHIRRFDEAAVAGRAMGANGALFALRANGKEFPIEASISQVVVGRKKLFTVILRDVTDRMKTEEAVRHSETRRTMALAGAGLGDWEIDLTTGKTTRSLRHNKVFGYSSAIPEWTFKVFLDHVHPEDREIARRAFENCISQRSELRTECRIIWPNGEVHWILARGAYYEDPTGNNPRVYGSVEDITDQKNTADALHKSEENLRLLLDGVKDYAVYMLDPQGRVETWNEGATRIKGFSAEEVLGKSMAMFYTPEDRAKGFPSIALDHALATGRFENAGRRVRKDGSTFWAHVVILPMYDAAGKVRGFSKVLRDISEQMRAEAALMASEQQFQTLSNSIPQLVWMAEPNGEIFWYNQRWYEYTGTNFEQMQGWAWQSVHDPAVLPRVLANWKSAISAGELFDMEFPLRGADGVFRMFLTRVLPLKDSEGRVVRWFGTNTDISERKQAEEQLARQAEELSESREALESQAILLQSVLDSIVEGLVAADADGKFLLCNPAAEKILGLSGMEMQVSEWVDQCGIFLADTITPFPRGQDPLSCALRGQSTSAVLFVKNGAMVEGIWMEASANPLRDKQGLIRGGVTAFRDITARILDERKISALHDELERRVVERTSQLQAANTEVKRSRTVLQGLFESLPAQFLILTPDLKVVFVSDAFLNAVYAKREQLVGRNLFAVPENPGAPLAESIVNTRASLERVLQTSAPDVMAIQRHLIRRPDGVEEERYWSPTNIPVLGAEGQVEYIISRTDDVTEFVHQKAQAGSNATEPRTRLQQMEFEIFNNSQQLQAINRQLHDANARLLLANEESEAANRAKSTFLSTMSHEIRTPMNAILGYAQLMARDPSLGADAKANLKIIWRSGEHLLGLINDVLDMAKIEAGRIELKPATFRPAALFEDLAMMFRLRAELKGLRFEMLVNNAFAYVVADEGKIRQVLINLLGNAVKFTDSGHVKAQFMIEQLDRIQLSLTAVVEDTGAGISEREQGKLFQPFTQARRGVSSQEGTGLGLAISRQYARLMGGDITMTSSPGKGSTFTFRVPVEPGDAGTAIKRSASASRRVIGIQAGTEVPRVLIVDDQPDNRELLIKLLTSIGLSVRSAPNGQAAIQVWEEWHPQLILMDRHMPIMDGLQATRRIKAEEPDRKTIVIVLTASVMDAERRSVFESGADDFLAKPCDEHELLEKLGGYLEISYEYAEPEEDADQFGSAAPVDADKLSLLSPGLIEELLSATGNGDMTSLKNLMIRVEEAAGPVTADALRALAEKYEYDALTHLLEPYDRRG